MFLASTTCVAYGAVKDDLLNVVLILPSELRLDDTRKANATEIFFPGCKPGARERIPLVSIIRVWSRYSRFIIIFSAKLLNINAHQVSIILLLYPRLFPWDGFCQKLSSTTFAKTILRHDLANIS